MMDPHDEAVHLWELIRAMPRAAGVAEIEVVLTRLSDALAQSIQLQAHYAELLNMHDGGHRIIFPTVEAWLERLQHVERLQERLRNV